MPTSTGLYDTSTITYDQSSLSYDGYLPPLANMPAVGVYLALNDGPYTVDPNWVDVSAWTRNVSIKRGRNDDLQQFPSGQCSIDFDNRDRLFDPFNDSLLVTRTNLVPNPSFETDASLSENTSPAGSSIARSTTVALFGSASLAGSTGATTGSLIFGTSTSTRIAVSPSVAYTASLYIRSAAVSRTAYARILFYDSGGSVVQTNNASNVTTSTTAWSRSFVTATAPASAVTAIVQVVVSSAGATETHYIDGLMLEQASAVGTYFDGNADPYSYGTATTVRWTGAVDGSASTRTSNTARINLVRNPSFETDAGLWTTGGSAALTLAQSTAQARVGSASLSCTALNAGNARPLFSGVTGSTSTAASRIPISAGMTYTLSAWTRAATTARLVDVIIEFYDSNNTNISSPETGDVLNSTTAWTLAPVLTTVAPTTAVSATISVRMQNVAIGEVHYVDSVMLEQSSSAGTYFDGGSLTGGDMATGRVSSWTGTAGGSTSQLTQFPNAAVLKPRRQVKVVAIWNGVAYPLFRGFVAGWPVEYTEAGLDSTVTVDCFDALALLATEKYLLDWPKYAIQQLNPYRYYKCDDTRSTATVLDQSTTSPSLPLLVFNEPIEDKPLITGAINNCLNFMAASAFSNNLTLNSSTTRYNVTLSFVAEFGNYGSVSYYRDATSIYVYYESANRRYVVEVGNNVAGTNYYRQYRFNNLPVGNASHFVVAVTADGVTYPTAVLYVNGYTVAESSTATSTFAFGSVDEWVQIDTIKIQEFAVYNGILSASQITGLSDAMQARFVETSSARMSRLFQQTNFPSSFYSLTTAPVATVAQIGVATSAFVEMQYTNDSESGELFVAKDGITNFYERNYWAARTRCNTSQMTFTDVGTGIPYSDIPIRMDFSADQIRNDVNVQFTGDGIARSTDSTSVSTVGAAQETINTFLDTPTSAQTLASYRVSVFKNPKLALDPFMAKGQQAPTYNWPRLLGLELLDRVTFKRTPSVGSAVQRDLLVQAIEHRITPGTWETVVNGSTRYTGWFILGKSLLGSSEDVLL